MHSSDDCSVSFLSLKSAVIDCLIVSSHKDCMEDV